MCVIVSHLYNCAQNNYCIDCIEIPMFSMETMAIYLRGRKSKHYKTVSQGVTESEKYYYCCSCHYESDKSFIF